MSRLKMCLCYCFICAILLFSGASNAMGLDSDYFFTMATKCIKQNTLESFESGLNYLKLAGKNGNAEAYFELGNIYAFQAFDVYNVEKFIKVDREKARKYYHAAAQEKHIRAIHNLGAMYLYDDNIEMAIWCFKQSSRLNCNLSYFQLGIIYKEKEANIEEAIMCFNKALENAVAEAHYYLGFIYADTDSKFFDKEKARVHFNKFIKLGNGEDLKNLARRSLSRLRQPRFEKK